MRDTENGNRQRTAQTIALLFVEPKGAPSPGGPPNRLAAFALSLSKTLLSVLAPRGGIERSGREIRSERLGGLGRLMRRTASDRSDQERNDRSEDRHTHQHCGQDTESS